MRLLACLIVAPQRGYDEPAILSYAISSFCPTSADGLHGAPSNRPGDGAPLWPSARSCWMPMANESEWDHPMTQKVAPLATISTPLAECRWQNRCRRE